MHQWFSTWDTASHLTTWFISKHLTSLSRTQLLLGNLPLDNMRFLKKIHQSFTLIELSVILFIVGAMTTAALAMFKARSVQQMSDHKKVQAISDALVRYYAVHKRLPRPANLNVAITNANFGTEVALGVQPGGGFRKQSHGSDSGKTGRPIGYIVSGMVPVTELGLPAEYAFDSYGNRIEYWTHDLITRVYNYNYENLCYNGSQTCRLLDFTTSLVHCVDTRNISSKQLANFPLVKYRGNYKLTDNADWGFHPYNLSLWNDNSDREIARAAHNTVFVVLTHGKDGKCSYNRAGVAQNAMTIPSSGICGDSGTANNTAQDQRVCNCVAYWNKYYKYSNTGTTDDDNRVKLRIGFSNRFDNVVAFKTVDELVAESNVITAFATS